MRRPHLESLAAFEAHLAQCGSLDGCILRGLDLTCYGTQLRQVSLLDAVFLGCKLQADCSQHLLAKGAMLFPDLQPGRPYHPTRSRLYDLDELMAGFDPSQPESFVDTADYAIYQHFQSTRHLALPPLLESLAQRIHDHAIDDALSELLSEPEHQRVVGVMGGHAMRRGEQAFAEVAQIARELAIRGYFIATGGGPGAMEAANLGAWMAAHGAHDLEQALAQLATAPDYRSHDYLLAGYEVRRRFPNGRASLAIPTWFYGHEPTNQFAGHIAKYFSNSLREDGLLAIARHGVIYAPGSAGTVQEVFLDAAQNHYGTFELVSPMVFFGTEEWTRKRPVMPLLESLSVGRQYRDAIAVLDRVDDVVRFIETHPPVRFQH